MTEREPPPARFGISFEQVVMNAAFVVLVGSIAWGVLSRYVTEQPATWVEEVSSIAFAWAVFIGAAEVHRRSKHVSVDILTSFLPPMPRAVLAVASQLVVTLYCGYVGWLGFWQADASNSAHTSMLGIPLSVPYAGLALGFALIAVRSIQRLAVTLRRAA